jgi:hypothetical protein
VTDPDRIVRNAKWRRGIGLDTAAYLVDPGSVRAPGKHSAGMLANARPYLVAGNSIFVFPVGVEGFNRAGTATIGSHKYLGDNAIDGVTTHYEEARITLRGTFPGLTAQQTMVDCINVLRAQTPDHGLILYAEGVFGREQYVLAETWEFDHAEDDRTHSIEYTITFIRIGEGRKITDSRSAVPPPNPTVGTTTKGKPTRIFTAKDGAQTLRAIAAIVYSGDSSKWTQLVDLNAGQLADWQRGNALNAMYGLPTYQLPTFRFPIGTQFRY